MSLCVSAWCQVSSVYTGIRGPLNLAVHQEYPPKPLFNSEMWGGGGNELLSLICGCQGDLYDNCKTHIPRLCQFTSCVLPQHGQGTKHHSTK